MNSYTRSGKNDLLYHSVWSLQVRSGYCPITQDESVALRNDAFIFHTDRVVVSDGCHWSVSVWAVISLWHYHSTFSAADMYNLKLPVYRVMGGVGIFSRGTDSHAVGCQQILPYHRELSQKVANPSGRQWKLYVSFYWYCCEGGVWGTDVRWQTSRCYLFLHVCVCGYTVGAFSMVWPNCPVQRNCQGASRMSPENI